VSDGGHIRRRPVLAGIGAAAVAAFLNPTVLRAQSLARPSVLAFDVTGEPARLTSLAAALPAALSLTDRFATMPPYPEVPGALRRLKAARFRLFTLTDNTAAISGRQLTHGRMAALFDRRFSVDDTAKRHKPAPEAYAEVTEGLGVSPSEMCLVACHTWDTIGAQAAGWQAGLIKRPNNDVLDTAAQPQYVGQDLDEVADQIIAQRPQEHG